MQPRGSSVNYVDAYRKHLAASLHTRTLQMKEVKKNDFDHGSSLPSTFRMSQARLRRFAGCVMAKDASLGLGKCIEILLRDVLLDVARVAVGNRIDPKDVSTALLSQQQKYGTFFPRESIESFARRRGPQKQTRKQTRKRRMAGPPEEEGNDIDFVSGIVTSEAATIPFSAPSNVYSDVDAFDFDNL